MIAQRLNLLVGELGCLWGKRRQLYLGVLFIEEKEFAVFRFSDFLDGTDLSRLFDFDVLPLLGFLRPLLAAFPHYFQTL